MAELNEQNLTRFFEHRQGRVRKDLIADTQGLDTPRAQALLGDMVERGILNDEGDELVLARGADR